MNRSEFIKQLRATAEELKPLTQAASAGAATWNGTEYVKGGEKKPDSQAIAWWSTLVAVAEMIDSQEVPLSVKQIAYLDRLLFGGMGSLNDLYFDPKAVGPGAALLNKRLDENRRALFASFKN